MIGAAQGERYAKVPRHEEGLGFGSCQFRRGMRVESGFDRSLPERKENLLVPSYVRVKKSSSGTHFVKPLFVF